jgi:hypothetical protein
MHKSNSNPNTPSRRPVDLRSALLGAIIGLGIVMAWKAMTGPPSGGRRSYIANRPPEVPIGGTWINTERPLSLAELRGKVILLQFGFIG